MSFGAVYNMEKCIIRRKQKIKGISMAVLKLSVTSLMLAFFLAMTGCFGADNYDDCVIEKMQGQTKILIGHARRSCRMEFPSKGR